MEDSIHFFEPDRKIVIYYEIMSFWAQENLTKNKRS